MKYFSLTLFLSCIAIAQDSQDVLPQSLNIDESISRQTIVLPLIDVPALIEEDEQLSHIKKKRFGYQHE